MSKAEVIFDKVQGLPDSAQKAVLRMVEALAAGPTHHGASELAQSFQGLANRWRRETKYFSFMEQRALHPAYQRIIGMGWAAVPLLLHELDREPEHWLWALRAITGEEPAAGTETLAAGCEAWIKWGRHQGIISNGGQ